MDVFDTGTTGRLGQVKMADINPAIFLRMIYLTMITIKPCAATGDNPTYEA